MQLAIESERENERGSERRESVDPKRGSERHSVSDCAVESQRAVRGRAEVLDEERLVGADDFGSAKGSGKSRANVPSLSV